MAASVAADAAADAAGAFIVRLELEGAQDGPLQGRTVGVKDNFDLQGYKTGAGNPTWLDTHPPATATAPAVQALLDAGARVVGKTHMDELAYSLNGENAHYGTPRNAAAPGRIPGGSSSGSAAAAGGGLVDIGLGSDTAGSVRVPASYNGLLGFRPTHARVSLELATPLAPSFDTAGWFARDAATLKATGQAMSVDFPAVTAVLGPPKELAIASLEGEGSLEQWLDRVPRHPGARGVAGARGVGAGRGAGVRAGREGALRGGLQGDGGRGEDAAAARERIVAHVLSVLGSDGLLALPTCPGPAPLLNTPTAELELFRRRLLSLSALRTPAACPRA
eukprot:jgi/Tetstr1/421382/TSEL_012351.t1